MTSVRVLREGKEIQKLQLEPGREYVAGRADTCDILLNDQAVSRQHLKFFSEAGKWKVQVISRFGQLNHMGALHQNLELENGMRFYSGDFEFRFDDEVSEKHFAKIDGPVPAIRPDIKPVEPSLQLEKESAKHDPSMDEKTSIGFVNAVPFVRILNTQTQKTIDKKLDGNHWKAGRDPNHPIVLDEPASSRHHFEIKKAGANFTVTDLGSSNGTRLNGELMDEMSPMPLQSGDIITIGGTTIEFQVRDPSFALKLQQAGMVPYVGATHHDVVPAGARVEMIGALKKTGFKAKPIHMIIGGIVVLILALTIMDGPEKADLGSDGDPTGDASTVPATKSLTKQQEKYLEDTYNLAENLFKRQKYESSLIEIRKIHEIVPQYKKSRELENYAQEGINIKAEQGELETRREQEEKMREQIRDVVSECRKRNLKTVAQAESCLQTATEMDPENAEVKALISRVQIDEEHREQQKANQAAYRSDVDELKQVFSKAQAQEQKGHLLNAISTYTQVSQSSNPDPGGLKTKARAKVKELDARVQAEVTKSEQEANDLVAKEKFKEALVELQHALDLNPSNIQTKAQFDKVYNELNKRLRTIYGDSVIEESLGNTEAAKQKWNTIMEMDLKTGEYYQKAQRMLKRYGG